MLENIGFTFPDATEYLVGCLDVGYPTSVNWHNIEHVCLFVCFLFVCLFVCVCVCVCLFVCLFGWLFVCVFVCVCV